MKAFIIWPLVAGLASVLTLGACGGASKEGGSNVSYADTAKENYDKGMKALKNEAYIDAAKLFVYTKSRFPFSQYSVLAELRLSDADLESGHYVEAADGYKQFIKNHPNHEMVLNGYCQFRIGVAYARQMPDDWALTPPAYEKDQSQTVDAVRELGLFLDRYPTSPYAAKGREERAEAVKMLAHAEMMVAQFYWKRDRPRGTILRLETLLRRFPGNQLEADALWLLAQAYLALDRPDHAKHSYQLLVAKYPKDPRSASARGKIAELTQQIAASSSKR